jgi:hypothetical protein
MCARDVTSPLNAATCVGDAGAPLVTEAGDARAVLGVATFIACGTSPAPSAFTEAAAFRDFVLQPDPVWRPIDTGPAQLVGRVRPGHRIECRAPRFTGTVDRVVYWFFDGVYNRTLRRGRHSTYRVRRRDSPLVTCSVFAINAGGVARAVTH